jgi:hypothetical protein
MRSARISPSSLEVRIDASISAVSWPVPLGRCGRPDFQRIQRQHAPGLAFALEADAHAVVHGQRLAHVLVDQPVVRIGQRTVMVEACDAAPRQDGRKPGMKAHGEPPSQRIAHQAIHRDRTQMVLLQAQDRHRPAVEMRAQAPYQALQPHLGKVGAKIRKKHIADHGQNNPR